MPKPQKLFIATSNPGKLREMIPFALELFGPDLPVEGAPPPLDEETGETFLDNAWLKADALDQALRARGETRYAVLADDSGLEVDALDGRPGVHSARYAGDHVAAELHIEKLLRELNARTLVPAERAARYQCALALRLVTPEGSHSISGEGACEGLIGFEARGNSGFGYDPVFIVPEFEQSFGELSEEVKRDRSHRKHAFANLAERLRAQGLTLR